MRKFAWGSHSTAMPPICGGIPQVQASPEDSDAPNPVGAPLGFGHPLRFKHHPCIEGTSHGLGGIPCGLGAPPLVEGTPIGCGTPWVGQVGGPPPCRTLGTPPVGWDIPCGLGAPPAGWRHPAPLRRCSNPWGVVATNLLLLLIMQIDLLLLFIINYYYPLLKLLFISWGPSMVGVHLPVWVTHAGCMGYPWGCSNPCGLSQGTNY
jgi:hypothetical protein